MKATGKLLFAALLPFLAISLSTGCKKTDGSSSPLGTVPDHFAQRVMMEEWTGEWCGSCPYGESIIEQYKRTYGDSVIVASIHESDWLANSAYNPVSYAFAQYNFGFPCAAINRIKDPAGSDFWYSSSHWTGRIPALMSQDHKTGIALISSFSGDSATIEVHVAFKETNTNDMRLNVFLVENNIAAHAQTGAGSGYVHLSLIHI